MRRLGYRSGIRNAPSARRTCPTIRRRMRDARLILYTGLGVSRELLQRQRTLPVALEMPAWIDPLPGEPLASYARRMASDVPPGGPVFLGGVSFGAMVALEVARHVRGVAGVFLLAGALDGSAISPLLQPAARLARFIPLALGAPILSMSPLVYPLLGVTRRLDRRALDRVLPQASPALFRWGAWAAATWEPAPFPRVRIHHIHGGADRIIPVHRVRSDVIVSGAGHLLNLTHARVVNAFIMSRITRTLDRGTD
jgi:pimeloyl-ACP methyl ester carboxylesterase